jgi:hypothetical protein
MSTFIDYTKLTKRELGLLILANDDKAVEEHLRRVKAGEIKPTRSYTLEQIKEMAEKSERKSA